jgi:transcriptional regulator with XRE-family HTH domain
MKDSRLKLRGEAAIAGAQIVKKMRTQAKLSQKGLGRKLSVSQARVAYIESGRSSATIKTLFDIAEACGLRLSFEIEKQTPLK